LGEGKEKERKKHPFVQGRNQLQKNNNRFYRRQVYQLDLRQQRMCKNLVLQAGRSGICLLYCQKYAEFLPISNFLGDKIYAGLHCHSGLDQGKTITQKT